MTTVDKKEKIKQQKNEWNKRNKEYFQKYYDEHKIVKLQKIDSYEYHKDWKKRMNNMDNIRNFLITQIHEYKSIQKRNKCYPVDENIKKYYLLLYFKQKWIGTFNFFPSNYKHISDFILHKEHKDIESSDNDNSIDNLYYRNNSCTNDIKILNDKYPEYIIDDSTVEFMDYDKEIIEKYLNDFLKFCNDYYDWIKSKTYISKDQLKQFEKFNKIIRKQYFFLNNEEE